MEHNWFSKGQIVIKRHHCAMILSPPDKCRHVLLLEASVSVDSQHQHLQPGARGRLGAREVLREGGGGEGEVENLIVGVLKSTLGLLRPADT
jgi:hypothetical protein